MKAHYIPQCIIKNFYFPKSKHKLTRVIFNPKNNLNLECSITWNHKSSSVFYEKDKYYDAVERKLSINLEQSFCNLIKEKILNKKQIILTRKDLFLIRKYMLVSFLRSLSLNDFKLFLLKLIDDYKRIEEKLIKITIPNIENCKNLNLEECNIGEVFNNTLDNLLNLKSNLSDLINKNSYKEIVLFSWSFLKSYINFWDASEKDGYILNDKGYIYENELEFYNLKENFSKFAEIVYLLEKQCPFDIAESCSKTLLINNFMRKNFIVFPISSKKSIVLINYFFKFKYTDLENSNSKNALKYEDNLTFMKNKKLFQDSKTNYVLSKDESGKQQFDENDKFVYESIVLSNEEITYLNLLSILQSTSMFAFEHIEQIIGSLYLFLYCKNYKQNMLESNIDINFIFKSKKIQELIKMLDNKSLYEMSRKTFNLLEKEIELNTTNYYLLSFLIHEDNINVVRKFSENFAYFGNNPNDRKNNIIKLLEKYKYFFLIKKLYEFNI